MAKLPAKRVSALPTLCCPTASLFFKNGSVLWLLAASVADLVVGLFVCCICWPLCSVDWLSAAVLDWGTFHSLNLIVGLAAVLDEFDRSVAHMMYRHMQGAEPRGL